MSEECRRPAALLRMSRPADVPASRRVLVGCAVPRLLLSACVAAPPVQEMSDARQAIAAAREAGAADYAGDRLQLAEGSLADAETQLRGGVYRSARRSAVTAKESAIDALLKTRSLRDAEAVRTRPTGSPAAPWQPADGQG